MRRSLFRPRPKQRIQSRTNKRLVPPLRMNPLTDHTVPLYKIGPGGRFQSKADAAEWKTVYREVLKIISAVNSGGPGLGSLKNFVNNNATFQNNNDGKQKFLPAVYTVALWFGFITTRDSSSTGDRLFSNPDQYYERAISYLILLAGGDPQVTAPTGDLVSAGDAGDAFQSQFPGMDYTQFVIDKWNVIWQNASTALRVDPNIPITQKIASYLGTILAQPINFPSTASSPEFPQSLSQGGAWSEPQYTSTIAGRAGQRGQQSRRQTAQPSAIQKEALKQAANARIDRFMATYGKNEKRVREMAPFAFNIFYNGRTGNIPTVNQWQIPAEDFDNITGGEGATSGLYPITDLLKQIEVMTRQKRNAIIVYARSNGNAQVFITSASPASNLGRKHSKIGEFYIPVIEMTSFPQAAALLASGLINSEGNYKYSGEGTGFKKEMFPCCSPHTGFGQALLFARKWRSSKLRYKNMDILVYQEVSGNPQWMGYDPGTGATQYSYDALNVWDTYQKEFEVAKTPRIVTQQGDNEFWKNQDAPSFTTFQEVAEEEPIMSSMPIQDSPIAAEEIAPILTPVVEETSIVETSAETPSQASEGLTQSTAKDVEDFLDNL